MKRSYFSRRVLLVVALCFFPLVSYADTSDWNNWLISQVRQHPDIRAAQEQLLGVNASADALMKPIHNPELFTGVGRSGNEKSYQVGVQQTIDIWDRRGAQQHQAEFMQIAATAEYERQLLNHASQAIAALVKWAAAKRTSEVAQTQQKQLNALLELVETRQRAGDLGSIDAELTFLSLSQKLTQVAEIEADLQKAESKVRELLPGWSPERGQIPSDFWPVRPRLATDQVLLKHPKVATAHARWQSLKKQAEVARRSARAEPTIGFNAGRDEGQNTMGLSLSIPLNVRNNFNAETRAANQVSLEAEAKFRAMYRRQRFEWQSAYAAWQRFEQQYRRWQNEVQGRVESSAELLQRQWSAGDLSTTDYLMALNQRAESLVAGIELEKQTRLTLTEVLEKSGWIMSMVMPSATLRN
ncbi:TolC family protein [Bermanella sp. R86510]|uniref:TolC family protein n=1 Tax=unclassified Bermanella TaxID=2627862 RepID=UPI0037C9E55C